MVSANFFIFIVICLCFDYNIYVIYLLIGLIIAIIFVLYLIFCVYITHRLNKEIFLIHGYDPDNPCFIRKEDYPNLLSEKYTAYYYKKKINGFIYYLPNKEYKGFIILSHGLFGTHIQYLKDIYFLASLGYKVLAYDQYGCGISEGKYQEYLAHGIYVCENVITDVIKRNINGSLPLILYGHSWGAYSVCGASRNFPEIKKVIARSGPISPKVSGRDIIKKVNVHLYRFVYFGYIFAFLLLVPHRFRIKSTRGPKKNTTSKFLFIHAKDDDLVLYKHSLADYYLKHKQNNCLVKVTIEGQHNSLISIDGLDNYKNLVKEYKTIKKESNINTQKELELQFNKKIKNRDLLYPINKEVEKQIIEFLND